MSEGPEGARPGGGPAFSMVRPNGDLSGVALWIAEVARAACADSLGCAGRGGGPPDVVSLPHAITPIARTTRGQSPIRALSRIRLRSMFELYGST